MHSDLSLSSGLMCVNVSCCNREPNSSERWLLKRRVACQRGSDGALRGAIDLGRVLTACLLMFDYQFGVA